MHRLTVLADDSLEGSRRSAQTGEIAFRDRGSDLAFELVERSRNAPRGASAGGGEVNDERAPVLRVELPTDEFALFESVDDVRQRRPLVSELMVQRRDRRRAVARDVCEHVRFG